MDFSLDDDRALLKNTLDDFARAEVAPKVRAWDEVGAVDPAVVAAARGLGLLAAEIPAAYGGAADLGHVPSALTGVVALEALAAGDLAFAIHVFAAHHVAVPVALAADDTLKEKFLPPLVSEQPPVATGAWIEPARTWDLFASETKAEPGLTGTKALVPFGADPELVLVHAAGGACVLFRGTGAVGFTVGARETPIGPRAVPFYRLHFDGAIGTRIFGLDDRTLACRALVASAAAAVGVARAAASYAADYARARVAFGRPIAQNQSIAFKIAEAFTDVDAARLLLWRAAARIDAGESALRESTLAFRYATDAAFRIADDGVQILGGHGVIRDHPAELYFRNARALATTPGWFIV